MALPDKTHRLPVQVGPFCKYHGGERPLSDIKWVVIHTSEGGGYPRQPSARALARWGAYWVPSDNKVSWHFAIDDNIAVRCLWDKFVSFTAYSEANAHGLHIEICGHARWSREQWMEHKDTLKRVAWVAARWAIRHKIPAKHLSDESLRLRRRGFISHAQITRVFDVGSHTDPGANFPWTYFMRLVTNRVNWIKAEQEL